MRLAILIILSTLCIVSCNNENKQVTFSGQIINPTTDMVWVTVNDSTISTKLDDDGEFKFELLITEANKYRLDHGGWTYVFLKPGSGLHISLDTKDFDRSISYRGNVLEENEYLKNRLLIVEGLEDNRFEIPNLDQNEFDSLVNSTLGQWKKKLLELTQIESEEYNKFRIAELTELNELNVYVADFYNRMAKLQPGSNAIDFNCIDKNGQAYSLNHFQNKILCIDIWASWCTACIKEIPYFERLADKYENYDVTFIGISIDDNIDDWKESLEKRKIQGLQLWAQGGSKSEFYKNYQLRDVPAYIVIDSNGKIVNVRAPRPSENLEEIIVDALNIEMPGL